MRRALPLLLAVAALAACNYSKTRVAIDLTNKSHAPIKNIEVNYPGGTYGVTALDVYSVNHHTVEMEQKGCVLKVKFEDSGGHALGGQEIKVGDTCPPKISLIVDAQMAVSTEPAK